MSLPGILEKDEVTQETLLRTYRTGQIFVTRGISETLETFEILEIYGSSATILVTCAANIEVRNSTTHGSRILRLHRSGGRHPHRLPILHATIRRPITLVTNMRDGRTNGGGEPLPLLQLLLLLQVRVRQAPTRLVLTILLHCRHIRPDTRVRRGTTAEHGTYESNSGLEQGRELVFMACPGDLPSACYDTN